MFCTSSGDGDGGRSGGRGGRGGWWWEGRGVVAMQMTVVPRPKKPKRWISKRRYEVPNIQFDGGAGGRGWSCGGRGVVVMGGESRAKRWIVHDYTRQTVLTRQ